MHARDLMTQNPTFVSPTDTIKDAAVMMASYDIGSVPVVDNLDGGQLVGVLTDRDIVVRCTAKQHDATKCSVGDHMTRQDLVTAYPQTPLSEVVSKMERSQIRRIPIVDTDNHLLGVVSQADLARCVGPDDPALVEEMLQRVSAPSQNVM